VGTAPFSATNTIWPAFATLNGLDPTQIPLTKADPNTLTPLLATGKLDATIDWVTATANNAKMLRQAGKELVVIPWAQ